jgi:hypothetical protein
MGLEWFGDAVRTKIQHKIQVGLMKWAQEVMEKSKSECPVLTGQLRDSARVDETKDGVVLSYNTDYAVKQHETNPTHPKFLENPVMEAAHTIGAHVEKEF